MIWSYPISDETVGCPEPIIQVYIELRRAANREEGKKTGGDVKGRRPRTYDRKLDWCHLVGVYKCSLRYRSQLGIPINSALVCI